MKDKLFYLSTSHNLEERGIRGTNIANAIAIMDIMYGHNNPIAIPIDAENHIDAAVVLS